MSTVFSVAPRSRATKPAASVDRAVGEIGDHHFVARRERNRPQDGVEAGGDVRHEHQIVGARSDEPGDRPRRLAQPRFAPPRRRLVARPARAARSATAAAPSRPAVPAACAAPASAAHRRCRDSGRCSRDRASSARASRDRTRAFRTMFHRACGRRSWLTLKEYRLARITCRCASGIFWCHCWKILRPPTTTSWSRLRRTTLRRAAADGPCRDCGSSPACWSWPSLRPPTSATARPASRAGRGRAGSGRAAAAARRRRRADCRAAAGRERRACPGAGAGDVVASAAGRMARHRRPDPQLHRGGGECRRGEDAGRRPPRAAPVGRVSRRRARRGSW